LFIRIFSFHPILFFRERKPGNQNRVSGFLRI
jgi:hypothetical protein